MTDSPGITRTWPALVAKPPHRWVVVFCSEDCRGESAGAADLATKTEVTEPDHLNDHGQPTGFQRCGACDMHLLPDDCITCGEGVPPDECSASKRPCGHHCNCSWTQTRCCWCGLEFGEAPE